MLTHERLKEIFHYDPITGIFTRKIKCGNKSAGSIAGGSRKDGYLQIGVDDGRYLSHRLAWLYMTGDLPKNHIDHIDGNRKNNAFSNLRDVTRQINLQNLKRAQKNNKSTGLLGVTAYGDRFIAQITINSKQKYIGIFSTPEEAHDAYLKEKRKHHEGCTI